MKPIRTYNVLPRLPQRLERLSEIAMSFWFDWDYEALHLFLRLDLDLWDASGHNPIRMLGMIPQELLEARAEDEGFLAHYDRVCRNWDRYLQEPTWYDAIKDRHPELSIAYFSFEFGISECLPIYSGGLGVLSGDHMKSSSDLGLPLIGVGMLYQQGYFRQYLNTDGWQGERYPDNDFYTMPVRLERNGDGQPRHVTVQYPTGPVHAQVWTVQVGRARLVMLDTNIAANARAEDRAITNQLYGGDTENRIRQEIMLGVGGLRALETLGVRPDVCHLNEGHSAFLTLERIRTRMQEDQLSFDEARVAACAGHVFTTHTPVPAGNEIFPARMVEQHLRALFGDLMPIGDILALGRKKPREHADGFGMTVFAINMSDHINGVSKLHASVSRDMWKDIWPQTPVEDVPIRAITNGVHAPTWISHDMGSLFERYLDPDWRDQKDPDLWKRIENIPDEELFRTHDRRREKLVVFARGHIHQTLMKRRATPQELARVDDLLDPEALTIVFSRRFATYKRGALLLRDMDRLKRLVQNADRPVQFLFAGKAHPHDTPGKQVIREIAHAAETAELRDHFLFLEDYDMRMARYLVQGADVWLNTPRRPLEASGTSGMKAAMNGGLNVSILDGWYDEAHQPTPEIGWAIGGGEVYEDLEYQDKVECEALYTILEEQVLPMFFDRRRDGIPHQWVRRMKKAMVVACARFNTNAMVRRYVEKAYLPAAEKHQRFAARGGEQAKAMAEWLRKMRSQWSDIRIEDVISDKTGEIDLSESFHVRARVHLGRVKPEEVLVELYHGEVDPNNEIRQAQRIAMECQAPADNGDYMFLGHVNPLSSGHFGYSVRILPRHPDLATPFVPELITWAGPSDQ